MKKKDIILIGAGGHAKVCIDIIECENKFKILGFVDSKKKGKFLNYDILGEDKILKEIFKKVKHAFVSIGHLSSPELRWKKFFELKSIGYILPVIKSPFSVVSKRSSIGEGSIVMHNSVINSGAKIGVNCIMNSMSLIEHDVKIGDFSHIATNAIVNGDVKIGKKCFIGSSAVIREGVVIKDKSFIKANTFIKK